MDDIKKFEPLWGVWKTEALIGEGSYGKVYRAVREEFGRKYYSAVKHISIPTSESQITEAISEGIADDNESVKEYFEAIAQNLINEITLMNDVKGKSNIVSYEDHLIIPKSSGVGYDIIIRMELLTGLNDILRHKQLTNKDVIKLGIDLCSALEVCVEKGIVHRDIKPSNIFVSDNGDYKLGDFGVARELEHTTSAMSKKGTYVYMAPEVYRGESANFSADIFSLGIVMYRLLNGNRAPFLPVSAKIKPGDNENALARRMSGEQLPAPAFAEEGLAQIILKATQFDRTKRYASPTEMKNDLIRLSGGTVLERTIPIIAEPTHNSVSFQKRNAADNQGTVILFPEQEMSNPQVSNAARSNEAAYAPQMPVYNNTVPQQTNGTVYTTPASVNRPVQNPLPVNYQQGNANTKSNRMSAPIIALLCVLIGGLLIGFVVMIALSAGKVDTVDSVDETVSSMVDEDETSSQDPFEANAKHLDNSYIIADDYKTGNSLMNRFVYQYGDYIYYGDSRGSAMKALSIDGLKVIGIEDNTSYYSLSFFEDNICYVLNENIICIYNITSHEKKEIFHFENGKYIGIRGFYNNKIYYELEYDDSNSYISEGLYCVDISSCENQLIYKGRSNYSYINDIQIYHSNLYANINGEGIIKMDLDGQNVERIIKNNAGSMIIYKDFIYTLAYNSGIIRYDLNGENKTTIIKDSCLQMDIYDDKIFYNPEELRPNSVGSYYSVGGGVKCFDIANGTTSQIWENDCYLIACSGNWVYFEDWSTNQQLCRVRLDGTGYMDMP